MKARGKRSVKKAPAKKRSNAKRKAASMRKPNAAFLKASKRRGKLSAASGGFSSEVTKKIWAYIKEHNLQEDAAERPIFAATLEPRHLSRAQIAAMVKTVRDKF